MHEIAATVTEAISFNFPGSNGICGFVQEWGTAPIVSGFTGNFGSKTPVALSKRCGFRKPQNPPESKKLVLWVKNALFCNQQRKGEQAWHSQTLGLLPFHGAEASCSVH
jgi:hypothetical protein